MGRQGSRHQALGMPEGHNRPAASSPLGLPETEGTRTQLGVVVQLRSWTPESLCRCQVESLRDS